MNKTVKNAIITGIITFPIGIAIGYSYQGRKRPLIFREINNLSNG